MEFTIRFDKKHIMITVNFETEWNINNKIHNIVRMTDREIQVQLKNNFDVIKDTYYVDERNVNQCFFGKGSVIFPLPKVKNPPSLVKIHYVTSVPILISSIGYVKDSDSLIIEDTFSSIFRRSYFQTDNFINYKNIYLAYPPLQEQILSDMAKNLHVFIKKCYKFFQIEKDFKYLISIFETDKLSLGGFADIYKGCLLYTNTKDNFILDGSGQKHKMIDFLRERTAYHELFHQFNPGFGVIKVDNEGMWFREGFCEYFSNYILNDEIMPSDILKSYLEAYQHNKYKNLTKHEMVELLKIEFNTNYELREMPYQKGFCYANWLIKNIPGFIDKYKEVIRNISNGIIYTEQQIGEILDKESYIKFIINGGDIF